MKRILLLTISLIAFCFGAFGQDCPIIKVVLPSKNTFPGNSILFSVSIKGKFDNSNLQYEWTVSNGKISDGLRTTAILVETSNETSGEVTATVNIKGLPKGCQNSFSETHIVTPSLIREPLDKLGKMSWQDEWVRLNSFAIEFLNYPPQTQAYFVFSIAKHSEIDLVFARQKRILKFLAQNKIQISRIRMVIEKGYSYQTTIWIVERPN